MAYPIFPMYFSEATGNLLLPCYSPPHATLGREGQCLSTGLRKLKQYASIFNDCVTSSLSFLHGNRGLVQANIKFGETPRTPDINTLVLKVINDGFPWNEINGIELEENAHALLCNGPYNKGNYALERLLKTRVDVEISI